MNRFPTLNDALDSEGLIETWNPTNPPLSYNETRAYTFDDGSKYGLYVSIHRFDDGAYERPIHYKR